jgi:Pyruvate/2-oxoacid:ferredoxin oxidoreductase delta subunit
MMNVKNTMKRKIVQIDEEKCNGCGACIPNCHEGAIQIVDGKARLVSDKFCDGLGACLGHCPQGAIRIVEREAEDFDEAATQEYLKKISSKEKPAHGAMHGHAGCPSSRAMSLSKTLRDKKSALEPAQASVYNSISQLTNWPLQLSLVPVNAPYLENADLLIAADCVAFSLPDFHGRLLKDKTLIIACPKLDDTEFYLQKLTQIFGSNGIRSITIAHMEVPCCFGLKMLIEEALERSKKEIPVQEIVVSIDGKVKE